MKKLIVLIIALCVNFSSNSQEEIARFENHLKTSSISINDAIPIVNEQTQEISLIFTDPKQVYGYLLDSNFKIINEFVSDKRSRKYKTIIGSSVLGKNYILFLANNKRNKFASVRFSYENDESKITESDLDLNDEKFIQTAEHNNRFYLFTVKRYSSILNVYVFEDESKYEKKEIDLSQSFDKDDSLYNLLTTQKDRGLSLNNDVNINKIEDGNPNAIEITSENTKMYQRNAEIIFSFDDFKDFTKIVSLNLNDFIYEIIEFDKPFKDEKSKSTNSFIHNDKIYMVASTKKKFNFSIHDFQTGNLIKEYNVNVDEEIKFKNTPLIQVGGMYDGYRELEKTQKFLRKVTNGDIGVSVFEYRDKFEISIGGKQETRNNGGMMMGGMGFPVASFGAATVFFNPTMFAYNSYIHTKSIHFKGLFDENYNHIEGEIELNVFDKINEYEKENKKPPGGKSIFRYKDYYILGTFSRWPSKEYTLRKFNN